MRKLLAFLVLLMLPWTAKGQALADWYYWFDTDTVPHESGKVTNQQFQLQTDVSHLSMGAHTLYIQVADTAGVYSPPLGTLFFKVPDTNELDKLFYSIDAETEIHATNFGNGTFSLDVSRYSVGFHSIHLQVMDKQGSVSDVMSYLFYKVPTDAELSSFCYWFDNDNNTQKLPFGQGHYLLDVSKLIPGLHFVNYYIVDGANNMTDIKCSAFFRFPVERNQKLHYWFAGDTIATQVDSFRDGFLVDVSRVQEGFNTIYFQMEDNGTTDIQTEHFIKIPQTENAGDMTVVCIIDGKIAAEDKLPNQGGTIKWDMDVSNIEVGLHKAMFQVITPSGSGSSIAETYFIRTLTNEDISTMQCSYTIDGFKHYVQKGTLTNGVFHFDLPVSNMEDGLHRLDYMLVADNGATTTQGSAWFFKTPIGGNGITQYDYWLNNKSDQLQSVTLEEPTDPFRLIKLLPVSNEPIRSSCFHFEVKDDKPMVYAKNDIHFRFHDRNGRWVDADNQYIDYQIGLEVEPVGDLQATQTFEKVAENDIRWYTMQAAPGDTAAFRVSQAATVQVFAPSGKEVFKTSESTSVKWNGIHTWENGTYYVAVHDVTGTQNTMMLDYMHMDKYDVVDWDVRTVGNGGCSTITFKGNGFRDLYAVDLVNAKGDTIHSVDVGHESDAETSVTFDFTGAALGKYNAIFHFTQEDKPFAKVVTVEEAVDIKLATTVSFPSTFLRGTSTTYTIKITNKGNMTAYDVPLELKLKTSSLNDISHVKFGGQLFSLVNVIDVISNDSIDDDIFDELQTILNNKGDLTQFAFIHDSIDNVDYGITYVFMNLPPNTTRQITVTIRSTSDVYLSAYMTSEWYPIFDPKLRSLYSRQISAKRANAGEWLCCYRERVECVADVVGSIVSALPGVPPNINCGYQMGNTVAQAVYDIACSEGNIKERFRNYAEQKGQSIIGRLRQSAIDCVIGYFFGRINSLRDDLKLASQLGNGTEAKRLLNEIQTLQAMQKSAINKLYNSGSIVLSAVDCVNKFRTPIPNCPRIPNGGGGSSTPQPPSDPNDIYGYLSEAGSKFIADRVEKVNYTVEFENDTAFAEASAHTIVIKDTLDSRYFDLKSFLPTGVKLGKQLTNLDETSDVKTVNGVTSFLKTIDMRPEINAIAQVEGTYSQNTGIAEWRFTSLDPMTMESTDDLMQGILPVNYDGTSGIGEVMFEIGVKPNKADGTEIPNRAGIVFDYEEAILTPTWTNIVDATAPVSHVKNVQLLNDSIASVCIEATDELSGPWRYDVYVQYGEGSAWWKAAENIPVDSIAQVRIYEGIDHGFYVIVTDSAGNVEQKQTAREFTLDVFGLQEETNTQIDLAQGWNWMSHNQQSALPVDTLKSASIRMVGQTEELIDDAKYGWMGDLTQLLPTQMYKIQVKNPKTIQLSGRLFSSIYRSIPLYQGWNWIGYPMANTMSPAEALLKLDAEEGDMLIGQEGLTTYSDSSWTGTLTEMMPGQGYMYRSASNKILLYNAEAHSSSRRVNTLFALRHTQLPDVWMVEKRKYPNVMGVIAVLMQNNTVVESDEWIIGAFCDGECRGISSYVADMQMMNVYGLGGEPIVFYAMNRETGEILAVAESELFEANVLGSIRQPYQLHIGDATGISGNMREVMANHGSLYDLHGRKVEGSQLKKGIYVTTDKKRSKTQKVIRR